MALNNIANATYTILEILLIGSISFLTTNLLKKIR